MALVLPITFSAFYSSPQLGEESYNFTEWSENTQEHGSCRESENFSSRTLAFDQQYDLDIEGNCLPSTHLSDTSQAKTEQPTLSANNYQKLEADNKTDKKREIGDVSRREIHGQNKLVTDVYEAKTLKERSESTNKENTFMMIRDNPLSLGTTKRKLDFEELKLPGEPPRKISIRDNTPKQRRDEKKRILRMSVQKLRKMEDPEHVLHRAVLINNTVKKMQKEIREEKRKLIYGEALECVTFSRKTFKDCDYDSDLCSQNNNNTITFYDNLDFYDCRQSNERVADDILAASQYSTCYNIDFNKNDTCKIEPVSTSMEKQISTDMELVFNNLINALSET